MKTAVEFSALLYELATCATSLFLLALAVYRLYFHPLAQYPGPFLARLTSWYDTYHAYIGDKHINFRQLHEQYGTFVRYSPNGLAINDPAALKAIYGHGANVRKADWYSAFPVAPGAVSTLLAIDKQQAAKKRRIVSQAFSDSALRDTEQYVLDNVRELVGKIGDATKQGWGEMKSVWTEPLDLSQWMSWLGFDIMGDLVFGRPFGTIGAKPENREAIRLLSIAARRNYTTATMPFLHRTGAEKYLPFFRTLWLERLQYLAFGKKQVQQRTQDRALANCHRKDIFSFLLNATDPETGDGLSKDELWMEGNTLIVAGSDTASTTMAACLFHLTKHPQVLARLTDELRSTFTNPEEIRLGPKLHSCTYLRACIDETMRLSPPISGLLPRRVQHKGLKIPALGVSLPPGVDVGTCILALHHHASYVVNPQSFDPSRFLQAWDTTEDDADAAKPDFFLKQNREALLSVFNPFSLGPRSCAGKPLAYLELSLAVARVVWAFEMEAVGGTGDRGFERDLKKGRRREGEYHTFDWFVSKNEGPWVVFRRREEE
ncbi:hypothetical protein MBLNU230_g5194t1 [Neophaeotheca triangularis]